MAKGIQDIGDNLGYLYKTLPDGVTILTTEKNTQDGARSMRINGLVNAPLAASRSAVGTITVSSAAGAGAITAINIAAVNQIGANINVVSSTASVVAAQIAAAINAFTPGSGDNYSAQSDGAVVYIFSSPSNGTAANGLTITVSVTDPSIVTVTTAFTNGSSENGVYDSVMGYRYWIDADYGTEGTPGSGTATPTVLTYAQEITEYITNRGFQAGVGTLSLTVATDALSTVDRFCSITQIVTTNQGGAATDSLEYINPTKFIEGDIIFIRSTSASQVLTVKDAANASVTASPNIYLTDENDFIIQRNKVLMLRYTFDNSLGGIFVEMSRSVTGGIVTTNLSGIATLIGASSIVAGQTYYITDLYEGGAVFQGVSATQVSTMGTAIRRVPLGGSYVRCWNVGMAAPVIGTYFRYYNTVYQSATGAVGSDTGYALDTTNWTAIATTNNTYYKTEVHTIGYDFLNSVLTFESDFRGNTISQSYEHYLNAGSTSAMLLIQWGNDLVSGNKVSDAILDIANTNGSASRNEAYGNAGIADNSLQAGSDFSDNVFSGGTVVTTNAFLNFTKNTLHNTTVTGNGIFATPISVQYCNLTNSNITSNLGTTITYLSGSINVNANQTCTINKCSSCNNLSGLFSRIQSNVDCSIELLNGDVYFVDSNDGMTLSQLSMYNATVSLNVNTNFPVVLASACRIELVELRGEAKITANTFNTAGKIIRGKLHGAFAQIKNVVFDTATAVALGTVEGAARTGVQGWIDNFTLNNVVIDGNNSALSILSVAFDTISGAGYYDYIDASTSANNAWAFLDLSDAAIYAAGVLTVPLRSSHAKRLYLYNAAGTENITTVVFTAGAVPRKYGGPWRLIFFSGAGPVDVTTTVFASLAGNMIGGQGAPTTIALARIYDFVEISKQGLFYTLDNSVVIG